MRHLPIEHRANRPRGIEQEVAGAIVAVHDGNALRRRRRIAPHPTDRGANDRLRLEFVLVDDLFPLRELLRPSGVRLRRRHMARQLR